MYAPTIQNCPTGFHLWGNFCLPERVRAGEPVFAGCGRTVGHMYHPYGTGVRAVELTASVKRGAYAQGRDRLSAGGESGGKVLCLVPFGRPSSRTQTECSLRERRLKRLFAQAVWTHKQSLANSLRFLERTGECSPPPCALVYCRYLVPLSLYSLF